MHPIQLNNSQKNDYSYVDNHPKLTEIGKNGTKSVFLAMKATVNKFFKLFL